MDSQSEPQERAFGSRSGTAPAVAGPGAGAGRRRRGQRARLVRRSRRRRAAGAWTGRSTAERDAADAYARMAKAENTRRAYRAAVRAWCAWCLQRDLPPLPARRRRRRRLPRRRTRPEKLSPETLKLRRAAIRYLHRAAGCPVPHRRCLRLRDAGRHPARRGKKGQLPRKKVAATAAILRRLLAPIPTRPARLCATARSCWSALPARCAAPNSRRSCLEHLEKTDRGIRLTLPHSKGAQTDAVTVPLPYGDTELCPVHALDALAAGRRPHRRPGVPPDLVAAASEAGRAAERPPPLPRIGTTAITPQTVAQIVQARAVAAGFGLRDFGGHSLKRGALTTGMERGVASRQAQAARPPQEF